MRVLQNDLNGNLPVNLSVFRQEFPKFVQQEDLRPLDSDIRSIRVAIKLQVAYHIRGDTDTLKQERDNLLRRIKEIEGILNARIE